MAELHRERCQACSGDTPTLSEDEQLELLQELARGWAVEEGRLRRTFQFQNFAAAFALATRVALLAEREGHHPELGVGWGHLTVELYTHAARGLTRNDFVLAAKVDRVSGSAPTR